MRPSPAQAAGPPQRVLIDCTSLQARLSGIGRYTYELALHLRARNPAWLLNYFYCSRYVDRLPPRSGEQVVGPSTIAQWVKKVGPAARMARWARGQLARLNHPLQPYDVYIQPNYIPLKNIRAKRVVSVVHDLSVRLHPEWHPADRVDHFTRHFDHTLSVSDILVVDSEFIRREMLALGVDERRLHVVHPGCNLADFRPVGPADASQVRRRHDLPERFLLVTGPVEPRKNIGRLLQAYARLPRSLRKRVGIVVCGAHGWMQSELVRSLSQGGGGDIRHIGFVSDEDLVRLYCLADALVFPSLYEGFGLPPVEAMACGCPVVASNCASMPEVCGEAARYFDPLDVGQMSEALEQVLTSEELRQRLRQAGLRRARAFSWQRAAEQFTRLSSGEVGVALAPALRGESSSAHAV